MESIESTKVIKGNLKSLGRSWVVFAVVLFAIACDPIKPSLDPHINSIEVDPVVQGDEPTVRVSMKLPSVANKRVRRMTAEFRSTRDANRPYVAVAEEFSNDGNNNWSGNLPALNLGPYEVKVTILLRTGPGPNGEISPPIDEIITGTQSFSVGVDTEECFNFNAIENDTQGWSHGGYVQVQGNTLVDACPANVHSFGGALQIALNSSCVPEGQYRFDFVSPDVAGRPGWAQTQGLALSAGWNIPEMKVQPILLRNAAGLNALAPVNEDGDFIFSPMLGLSGGSTELRFPMVVEGGPVDGIKVRFFGAPEVTFAEGFAKLNYVCPIPVRPE